MLVVALFGVGDFALSAARQIVHADPVKNRQNHQRVHGVIQYTDFVLRVVILFDFQNVCNLFCV